MLTDDFLYALFYDSNGAFESANLVENGATVYVKNAPEYTPESNPLTADFLAQGYDLSDRPDLATPEILE